MVILPAARPSLNVTLKRVADSRFSKGSWTAFSNTSSENSVVVMGVKGSICRSFVGLADFSRQPADEATPQNHQLLRECVFIRHSPGFG
jgi:hypothetical protein